MWHRSGGPRQDWADRVISIPRRRYAPEATGSHPDPTCSALNADHRFPRRRKPPARPYPPEESPMSGVTPDRRRSDIVTEHMPLVGHLVREMLARVPAHVNRDDLMSAGYAALVHAARGFDHERGVPFARFAAARVGGALLDEPRGLDGASRSVRRRARRADGARQELSSELGRTPTVQEVAGRLGV